MGKLSVPSISISSRPTCLTSCWAAKNGLSKAEFEKSIPRQISDGLVHWSNLVKNYCLALPFAMSSLFVFDRFYGCKSPAVRKRKHYAIAPRRKENSVVSIGYILCAVIRCNLERDILTFFDIMVYICDRFVFNRLRELVESLLSLLIR